MKSNRNNKGFTLAEIVVTITILTIIIGVSIGGIYHYVGKSRINTDIANLSSMRETFAGIEEDEEFYDIIANAGFRNTRWDLVWDGETTDEARQAVNIKFHLTQDEELSASLNKGGLKSVKFMQTALDASTKNLIGTYINQYASHLFPDGLPKSQSGMTFMLSVYTKNDDSEDIYITLRGYLLNLQDGKLYYPDGVDLSEAIFEGNEEYAYHPNIQPTSETVASLPEDDSDKDMSTIKDDNSSDNKEEDKNGEDNNEDIISIIENLLPDFVDSYDHWYPEENDFYSSWFGSNYFDANSNEISGWTKDGTPVIRSDSVFRKSLKNQIKSYYENGDITEEQYNSYIDRINNNNYYIGSTSIDSVIEEEILDMNAKELLAFIDSIESKIVDYGSVSLHYSWKMTDKDKYSYSYTTYTKEYLDDNKCEIYGWDSDGNPYLLFGSIYNTLCNQLDDFYIDNKISRKQYRKYKDIISKINGSSYIATTANNKLSVIQSSDAAKQLMEDIDYYNDDNNAYDMYGIDDNEMEENYRDGFKYDKKENGKYYTKHGDEILGWYQTDSKWYKEYNDNPVVDLQEKVSEWEKSLKKFKQNDELSLEDSLKYTNILRDSKWERYFIILDN